MFSGMNYIISQDVLVNFFEQQLFILIELILSILFFIIIFKVFKKFIVNIIKSSKLSNRKSATLSMFLVRITKYIVIFIALCKILNLYGVPVASMLAVAGVGSIAIGFATQNLVKDFITGAFILLEDQYHVSDIVKINSIIGTVEEIGFRITKIRGFNGDLHIIPNSEILTVTNIAGDYKKAIIDVPVPYDIDTNYIINILEDEMKSILDKVKYLNTLPKILGISSFESDHMTIKIEALCDVGKNFSVERSIRLLIKCRLDKEGISMPLPQNIITIKQNNK